MFIHGERAPARVADEFIMALESCLDSGSETDCRVVFILLLQHVDSVMLKRRCHTHARALVS